MLLLADPRRIRRIRSLGHSLRRLTAAILGTDPTERRKIKGFAGSVPTNSI